jgi:CDP-diacylglycerol--glycerol-3-phosphate 3-phosphatidyltransferase
MIKNLPNILTFVRLGLIPIFVFLMIDPTEGMLLAATIVFSFAAGTDFADGLIARKYGAVSDLGKLLDPIADKILVMSALVMLVAQRSDIFGEPWVPGWMVVVILAREIWITGLRSVAAARGVIVAASGSGKWKSLLQMVAVISILIHKPFTVLGLSVDPQWFGLNVLFLSIAFSIVSAAEYTKDILLPKKQ